MDSFPLVFVPALKFKRTSLLPSSRLHKFKNHFIKQLNSCCCFIAYSANPASCVRTITADNENSKFELYKIKSYQQSGEKKVQKAWKVHHWAWQWTANGTCHYMVGKLTSVTHIACVHIQNTLVLSIYDWISTAHRTAYDGWNRLKHKASTSNPIHQVTVLTLNTHCRFPSPMSKTFQNTTNETCLYNLFKETAKAFDIAVLFTGNK